jgi:DNA-binding LacI/PurR family transcriptional regulator
MSAFDIDKLAQRLSSFEGNNYLSGVPLYECIRRVMHSMIQEGELPDGCRLPPDKDLARGLGVNAQTLSKALNELRNSGLLVRQRAKGTFVRAAGAASAAAVPGRGNQVGVVYDTAAHNTFQAELFVTLHNHLAAQGLDILFVSSSMQAEKQFADVQAMFLNPSCCGCIVWSIMSDAQVRALLQSKPRHFPLVILDKEYPGIQYDCVCYDVFEAAREAAQYHIAQGCQKLLFLAPERCQTFSGPKIGGIQSVLGEHPLDILFHRSGDILDLEKYRRHAVVTINCESLHWLCSQYQAAGLDTRNLPPVATFCTATDVLPPMPVLQLLFSPRTLGGKAVDVLLARLRGDTSQRMQFQIGHYACTLKKANVLAV